MCEEHLPSFSEEIMTSKLTIHPHEINVQGLPMTCHFQLIVFYLITWLYRA